MIQDKKVSSLEFLWMGLYAFAGFSLELILSFGARTCSAECISERAAYCLSLVWFCLAINHLF